MPLTPLKTCDCKICGKNTQMTGTKLCDSCWEIQRHGVEYVSMVLDFMTKEARNKTKSRITDEKIVAWLKRHDLMNDLNLIDARACVSDARSLHLSE